MTLLWPDTTRIAYQIPPSGGILMLSPCTAVVIRVFSPPRASYYMDVLSRRETEPWYRDFLLNSEGVHASKGGPLIFTNQVMEGTLSTTEWVWLAVGATTRQDGLLMECQRHLVRTTLTDMSTTITLYDPDPLHLQSPHSTWWLTNPFQEQNRDTLAS